MSVLGIQRRCNDILEQENELDRKSLLRRTLESLIAISYLGEPIADEEELYGRQGQKQPRGLEGRPHNPMLPGSSDEGMQEPFEAFITVEVELVTPKGASSRSMEQEVLQDDMRIDGMSILRNFRRPHQPCHHTTARKIAESKQRIALAAQRRWRDLERGTRVLFVALGSIDDSIVTAAAIAIGILVLVLLSIETALGRRRLRIHEGMTADFTHASRGSIRNRRHKRVGCRRSVSPPVSNVVNR